MAEGNYRGVVLRDDAAGSSFTMSILRADSVWWVPGQVKAVFTPDADGLAVRFFMRDHSEQRVDRRVVRNVLLLDQGTAWFRQWPARADDEPGGVDGHAQCALRCARSRTGHGAAAHPDVRRCAAHGLAVRGGGRPYPQRERLIIDLRGNGGGSDYNFRMLIPLMYTGPIRMISNAALATEENIAANEQLAADTTLPQAIRDALAGNVARMRTAGGGWYEFDDRVIDDLEVLDRRARIDVLVDRGCASSCEQFLLAARQSTKVTIFGHAVGRHPGLRQRAQCIHARWHALSSTIRRRARSGCRTHRWTASASSRTSSCPSTCWIR
jgi:hypothetical protein